MTHADEVQNPAGKPPEPCKPRILMVDNDSYVFEDWEELFERRGYDFKFICGETDDIVTEAREMAERFRPHVAVVDLRLEDDDDRNDLTGLELIGDYLGSPYCVLVSSYLRASVTSRLKEWSNVIWVSKTDPDQILEEVEDGVRRMCACQGLTPRLTWPEDASSEIVVQTLLDGETLPSGTSLDDVPRCLAQDVVYQMFRGRKAVTLEPLLDRGEPSITAARKHSVLLRATPDNLQPVIVKLGPVDRMDIEATNYQTHVNMRLGGLFYAEQLGEEVAFWDLGGICYQLLGAMHLRELTTFTRFFRHPPAVADFLAPLRHFFGEVWRPHYESAEVRPLADARELLDPAGERILPANPTVFDLYDPSLRIRSRLASDQRFPERGRYFETQGSASPLPNPVLWVGENLDRSRIPSARVAITHGDLHADNLLVDGQHAWVIDFERTGAGHMLRDFVELETDIVTRVLAWPPESIGLFYGLAVALAEPSSPGDYLPQPDWLVQDETARALLAFVQGLRMLAAEVTGFTDLREYLWGVLINALFVASLGSVGPAHRERNRILAAVICDRLQHWGQNWPRSAAL